MKKRDPYEVLGVDRKAGPEVIKKAYRRKARVTHPDVAGGGSGAFQELSAAYALLMDRERREDYDRTGNQEEALPDKALEYLMVAFQAALRHWLEKPHGVTLGAVMRQDLEGMVRALSAALGENRERLRRLEKLRGKITAKGDLPNFLGDEVEAGCRQMERAMQELEKEIEDRREAVKLLEQFEFPASEAVFKAKSAGTFGGMGVTDELMERLLRELRR